VTAAFSVPQINSPKHMTKRKTCQESLLKIKIRKGFKSLQKNHLGFQKEHCETLRVYKDQVKKM